MCLIQEDKDFIDPILEKSQQWVISFALPALSELQFVYTLYLVHTLLARSQVMPFLLTLSSTLVHE